MNSFNLENGVFIQKNDGFTTIFDYNNSLYYSLDEVASNILNNLLKEGELEKAVDQLLLSYEVDREQLVDDAKNLINQLEKGNLLRVEYVK
jgi:hypothetical protein